MIWGARTAIEVVVLSIVFCVVIGVPLGLVSGYYGGWMDRVLVLIMDAIFAFPSFLLAIVFSFLLTDIFGGSVLAVALSLTAIYIPQYFRVVRNTTVSAKEATYVEAARAMGAKDGVIMRRYLFGNVIQSVPVLGTLNAADAILTLAGLGLPRARHPVDRRARSGGTTSSEPSPMRGPGSGGPVSTRAWRSCSW